MHAIPLYPFLSGSVFTQESSGWCLWDVQGGLAPPSGPTQDHHQWGRLPHRYDPGMKVPITAIVFSPLL